MIYMILNILIECIWTKATSEFVMVKNHDILDYLLLYPCDSYSTIGSNLIVFFMMFFGSQ